MKVFSAKKYIEEKQHLDLFRNNEKQLKSAVQYDGMKVTKIDRLNGLTLIEIEEETILLSKIDCSVDKTKWQPYTIKGEKE